ncbi:MAG: HNH endonuclease [Terriglobales bacterium]
MTAPPGQLWVGITDSEWFDQLRATASRGPVDEVNFWRPSGLNFRALAEGGLFLFKLHAPRNVIAGGGFFTRAVRLPIHLAWQAFGALNGANSEVELRRMIRKHSGEEIEQPKTCIILSEPFFFADSDFIPVPGDFARNTQSGKTYALASVTGRRLWAEVQERIARSTSPQPGPAQINLAASGYGDPRLVAPRLGQGGFRIGVLEAYRRCCAISGERTVPVLEAAHIRRFRDTSSHELNNGLLLRSDLHKLFDQGYVTVTPDERRVLVSRRIREEFENGREYYALDGRPLTLPADPRAAPDMAALAYHAEHVFRG